MTDHPNLGSTFDSWLDEEGIAEDVEALAAKKKLVLALDAAMARRSVSRAQLGAFGASTSDHDGRKSSEWRYG